MAQAIKRIGVLTGGGDCPGLNAVIRAIVKTGVRQFGLEIIGIEDGYLGLIENRMRPLEPKDVSNILTVGGTILGSSNKANPANFAILKDGRWVRQDVTDQVMRHIALAGLDALVIIGGDGTMAGAYRLVQRGLRVVGVPKTIDNDLVGTEITFGHDTAVSIATDALDRVHTTAASHHRVMVVELMGRYAGWLALRAGLAGGADIILLPEIPFDLEVVAEVCRQRTHVGKRETIIAAGEGAHPAGTKQIVDRIVENSPDPIRLGGVARYLAGEIEQRTGLESRSIVLGHVQRGGTPTAADRVLATVLAHRAMELMMSGRLNELVVIRQGQLDSVPLAEVADRVRTVAADDPLLAAGRGIGVSFGDKPAPGRV